MSEAAVPMLTDINFFTTYRCNSRCLNCRIWQEKPKLESKVDLDTTRLEALFDDPLFKGCTGIGLAGGEPTISPFFWKLLEILPEDKHVTVTTNALNGDRLIQFLAERSDRQRFMIQVSVDGLGALHDRIRGVEGAFEKAKFLIASLQRLGINRLLSFTINRLNYFQLMDCYQMAQEMGARFSTRMAYCGGAYENSENKEMFLYSSEDLLSIEESLKAIIRSELEKPEHSPSQLVFLSGITDYFRREQKPLPCFAMETGVVIDRYGDVFPNCPAMMTSIGSLWKESLSTIWVGSKAELARERIRAHRCGGCWNDCQVVTNIQYAPAFLADRYLNLKRDWLDSQPVPDAIDFNFDHMAYLLAGWYDLERDGDFAYRWTEPAFSFLVPKATRKIELFGMVPDTGGEENSFSAVFLRAEKEREIRVSAGRGWHKFVIDLLEPLTDMTKCRISVSRSYCPKESGAGADGRRLGMAVGRILFLR